ncbi:MAG: carboxymuconolactone decarboxylase family protein [Acidimicrobiales bacterium]
MTGLARRERTGSEKRDIGMEQIRRMLPNSGYIKLGGAIPDKFFAAEILAMGMEDSYCDMWSRTEHLGPRLRSIATVSMMVGAGNVGNQFELRYHAPAAIYNGVTIDELAAIVVHARAYVGSPASAWAHESIMNALKDHGLLDDPGSAVDVARRERVGSEKRTVAREVLQEMEPDSALLDLPEELPRNLFTAELDFMILENVYFDLWARTDVLDRHTRSIVTVGMLIGLANHDALRAHVPVALRNGVTVSELEEIVYQAATYLGYPTGTAARAAIAAALEDAGHR